MSFFRTDRRILFLLALAPLSFHACTRETLEPSAYTEELTYFPLRTGDWIRYQVDSIVHAENDASPCQDSLVAYRFEVLEKVGQSFIDGEGELAYRIERFRRQDSLQEWVIDGVWVAKRTDYSAQRVENNQRFVKMSFPFDRRSTWNGNAYNSLAPESYRYEDIGSGYSYGGFGFPATVRVLQNDFQTSIGAIVKWEIYAKDVGMVEKYWKDVKLLYGCGNVPVIDEGLEYTMKLLDYGSE